MGEGGGEEEGSRDKVGVSVPLGVALRVSMAAPPGGLGVKGCVPLGVPEAVGGSREGVSDGREVKEGVERGVVVGEGDKDPPASVGVRVEVGFTREGVGREEVEGVREAWEGVGDGLDSRDGVLPSMME